VDAIVVNDVSDAAIGFESADNEVTVVTADGEERLPRGSKPEVAGAILDRVVAMRG
jgi:phosphopantothenoylcysteine decarboxylase/phosphopantothenate--cysteine ligase